MVIFGIIVTALLFAIGAPVYVGFALGSMIIILLSIGIPLAQLGAMYFGCINSFVLIAGALFVLAGNLMIHSGASKALVNLLSSCVSRIPGGVAIATIITCTFIGALTGSITATLAAVGFIMFPAMMDANYTRGYSGSVLCSSANLGVLIPPSIIFILFGFLTETSVAELFIAGVLPGFVMAALLSIVAILIAKRREFPLLEGATWKERGRLFVKALPAIFMPVIILGGIYGGIFTPTEAAAVACIYCIIIGIFVYRELNWTNFWASVKDTVQVAGMILLMIGGGMVLGKAFMLVGFPQAICNWVVSMGLSQMAFLLFLAVVFVGLGFFIEGMAMMFITVPLFIPAAAALNISLIHLGVIFCIAITIAGITPPVSVFLYATSGMFEVKIEELIREVLPFLIVMIISLFIVVLFPGISLWLPETM